jgi:hypothetical protein
MARQESAKRLLVSLLKRLDQLGINAIHDALTPARS